MDPSYYEECPHEYCFDPQMTLITGLGVGLLASVALSLSPRLADMPLMGAEAVRTAFRVGLMVDKGLTKSRTVGYRRPLGDLAISRYRHNRGACAERTR